MKSLLRIALLLSLLAGGLSVHAAPKKKRKYVPESDQERSFTVGVPKSEINLIPLPEVKPRPVEIEASTSSWLPRNFQRGGYLHDDTPFSSGGTPNLSLNRLGLITQWQSGVHLDSNVGVSYLDLQRTFHPHLGEVSEGTATERLNVFMLRIGSELAWAHLIPWGFEPVVGFSLLPAWASAETTAFEPSVSGFGLPYELTAGMLWRSPLQLSKDRNVVSVGVAWQAVSGNVAGSSLTGTGVLGELRISL